MTGNLVMWLLAVGVLVGTAWVILAFRKDPDRNRAWRLVGFRAASGIVLALALLQPQCRRKESVIDRPVVGVLVDSSQSMNDGPPDRTRAKAAREWLDSRSFRKAAARCELRYFSLDSAIRETVPGEIAFDGKESRIRKGLTEWVRRWGRENAAGVVLISDGLDTDGGLSSGMDLPCWTMEVEPPSGTETARIALWQVEPPRHPVAGAETSVRAVLQGWGVEGRDVPVELWSEGVKLGEKRVRFQNRGDVVEVRLPLKPERPGSHACELRVVDPAADASARSHPFVLAVRQEGRGILLLSNTLGFESKFLRRALTTDRNVRLDSYARWQDGSWASLGDGGGTARDELDLSAAALSARAAVVLADVSPDALTPVQWRAISEFANNGGGLAVLGGPNLLGSPQAAGVLGRVLPVPTPAPHRDGRFGVHLTDTGLRHPVFGPLFENVTGFPALQGANLATGVAGNAQVLMESIADGQSRPLVVVKQQGRGRVAVVLSDTLWRWRVAAPGWTGRLSPYDTFWAQLLDWLAPDQEGLQSTGRIELTTDQSFYRQGDKVVTRAEWIGKGEAPFKSLQAMVREPSGPARSLTLSEGAWRNAEGRQVNGFRGEFDAQATGLYQVEASASWAGGEAKEEMQVAVAASPVERRGEAPDAGFLREIAADSGGAYITVEDADEWLDMLPKPGRTTDRDVVTDIWNHPLPVAVLLGSLCAEWWLRRRSGLA